MGIKNVRTATYVADTGKEFNLSDMTSSHLLNAIRHHQGQLEVLLKIPKLTNLPEQENIDTRISRMQETIDVLYQELTSRDPAKDDELAPARNFNRDGGY